MDESFGILNKIENECRILDSSIEKYESFDIKSYLKQIGQLKVISVDIENKEIGIQERDKINEIKIEEFEIDIEYARKFCSEQKIKEKDELNMIDKCKEIDRIGMELKNLILQIDNDKVIIEREWCIFNDIMGDTEWEILKLCRILCNNIDILKDTEEGMELRSASNEYDKCFIYSSHGKYGSIFASSNYRIECYVQKNTNNGCKSSLNICMSSVNFGSDKNLVMLSGYLVFVNLQGWDNQRRVYDDCG